MNPASRSSTPSHRAALLRIAACAAAFASSAAAAATEDDAARATLPSTRPAWAVPSSDRGKLAGSARLDGLTLTLKRTPERQRAFEALLAAQRDPASPEYRKWLTPSEIAERFGPDRKDVEAVTAWLASEGFEVRSVSASRSRIRFGGTAAAVEKAFGTAVHVYGEGAAKRHAAAGEVRIPARFSHVIEAVGGLDSIRVRPLHRGLRIERAPSRDADPAASICDGTGCDYYTFPADFARIYNLEGAFAAGITGTGQTIAIIGRSRVLDADVANFRDLAGLPARAHQTVVVPDGTDPGPASELCHDPEAEPVGDEPACDSDEIGDQSEATMDVQLAGAAAPGATIKLVTSAETDEVDGVLLALEHALTAEPLIAPVVSMSYGTCEADNSLAAATYLDDLYAEGAARGISVFVSSGDAGAADCSPHHQAPDGDTRRSVNLLCSSEHVTCVGGTRFEEHGNPDAYWSRTTGRDFVSALGYIPEGAWNEPLDADGNPQMVGTGGGVSQYRDTPAWQVGIGVPYARTGRFVPDVSLNASATHGGYFICFKATGAACETDAQGMFYFAIGGGTSASAPGMAGIAALLNQSAGGAQGNLNPRLYELAADPRNGVFHDIDVASSGVDDCVIDIPSLCNNTMPGTAGLQGGVIGYRVGTGYDLATGLGSPDAHALLREWDETQQTWVDLHQPGLSGSWANPATSGQGIVLQSAPETYGAGVGLLFGGWFTYDTTATGGRRWYTLQGQSAPGASSIELGIYRTTGGRFDHGQATSTTQVGTATLAFDSCDSGRLSYAFDDDHNRTGAIPLTRLLANVNCSPVGATDADPGDHLLSGSWADTGNSGQGLVIEVNPVQGILFGAWYTFTPDGVTSGNSAGSQRWYTLQADYAEGERSLRDVGIFETTGGVFDGAAATETREVGKADIELLSCTAATLRYAFTAGASAGRSGTLDLTRLGAVPDGCMP